MLDVRKTDQFANLQVVSADYLPAIGLRLSEGRRFTLADRFGAPPVAIVNQAFVRRYFKGGSAVGQELKLFGKGEPWRTIIGTIPDTPTEIQGETIRPEVLIPASQAPSRLQLTLSKLIIRAYPQISTNTVAHVRDAIASVDDHVALARIETLADLISESMAQILLEAFLFLSFALLALILALVGIYGVVSFSLGRRMPELAIRAALGATPANIASVVLRDVLGVLSISLCIGGCITYPFIQAIRSLLVNIHPPTVSIYFLVIVIVLTAGLMATSVPIFRVSRVSVSEILRSQM